MKRSAVSCAPKACGFILPRSGRQTIAQSLRREIRLRGRERLHGIVGLLDQLVELRKQAFASSVVEILVVEIDHRLAVEPAEPDQLARPLVLVVIPMQHRSQLAAIGAEAAALGALAPVDAEAAAIGVIADMARLDDDEVLAVGCVGPMAVDRDLAADATVVEGKGAEMLGDQDDRIALAFVGAERPRRQQHAIALKAQRSAQIVKTGDKLAIAHRIGTDLQVLDHPLLHRCPRAGQTANKSV